MIEWFDFYGVSVCFSVNQEAKYRTKLGVFLTLLNLVLILTFVPVEFLSRETISHSWTIP